MPCEDWARWPIQKRIACVCPLRHRLAADPQPFIDAIHLPFRQSSLETLTAEIIPLADACRFLERNAARLLRTKHLGAKGRPLWLIGMRGEVRRVPLGTVLIIGPGNYPLMLPGIQIVQALVAGNHVVFKPAPGTSAVAIALHNALRSCGLPDGVLSVIDESPAAVESWWERIDKVIVTGSGGTGNAVMRKCAEHALSSTMELSGCDAVLVLPGADVQRVVKCVQFALKLNGGHSCIAPRRILVRQTMETLLRSQLIAAGISVCNQPQEFGSTSIQLISCNDDSAMIAESNRHSLQLGATVFGPTADAQRMARLLDVGSIVINDIIVPTADPRLPFGGAKRSGFGVTRGAEGLLEMTRAQVISTRRGGVLFHLRPVREQDEMILRSQFLMSHGRRWSERGRGLLRMLKAIKS